MPGSCRPGRSLRRRGRPPRSRRRRGDGRSGRRASCSRRAPSARRSPPRSARRGSTRRRRAGRGRPRPAQLLRVRDLADRRELVLADHDPVSLTARPSAETSALTPWETDVVTATSSAWAWSRRATAARNASFRSTQKSHSAPFASQPASHSSTASRTRCDSAPCEHELRYVAVSKIGNSARTAAPTRVDEAPGSRRDPTAGTLRRRVPSRRRTSQRRSSGRTRSQISATPAGVVLPCGVPSSTRSAPASQSSSTRAATSSGVPAMQKRASSGGSRAVDRRVESGHHLEIRRNCGACALASPGSVLVDDADGAEHDPHVLVAEPLADDRDEVRVGAPADLELVGDGARPGGSGAPPRADEERHDVPRTAGRPAASRARD